MNERDATEQAYKNGYEKGVQDTKIKWISVHDRLPKEYGKYLICDKHGNINVRTHSDEFRYPFDISPTHPHYYMVEYWAELPDEFFKSTDSDGSVGTVGTPINMEGGEI